MFSPASYYKSVPKDYEKNLRWRQHVLDSCKDNPEMQQAVRYACSVDIIFYINTFVYQYDPTQGDNSRVGPFITWGFQERYLLDRPETTGQKGLLWCMENERPVVWEKSREMGATWLMLISQDWLCLFHNHFQALDISKSADAVDCKSRNSLFAKIRFMHEKLPKWLSGELLEEKMYFDYKRTRSEISGEASTKRSGVGGRGGFVGIDEAAEIEELKEVREKLVSTAPFRLFVSTHLSTGNEFYALTQDPSFVVLKMHWTQHPEKNRGLYSFDQEKNTVRFWKYVDATDDIVEIPNPIHEEFSDYSFDMTGKPAGGARPGIRSPWYDKKSAEIKDDRGIAMQLDINPSGSVAQFYNAMTIRRLKQMCSPPLWEGDLAYDRLTGQPLEFVKRTGGLI